MSDVPAIHPLQALGDEVRAALPAVGGQTLRFGELTLLVEREAIVEVLTALRDEFEFQQLVDLCGADYPDRLADGDDVRAGVLRGRDDARLDAAL